jgi:hypothetical protein
VSHENVELVRSSFRAQEVLGGWVATFETFTSEPQEFIDAGDHVVVPLVVARPRESAATVTIEETQVFSDGAIVAVREFRTIEQALDAVEPAG